MDQFSSLMGSDLRILELALDMYQLGLGLDDQSYINSSDMTFNDAWLISAASEDMYVIPGGKNTVTAYVPVPTSEHVAEIIGRQGCKIKELRTKSNAYIKTPERGEEPVFVVTGRKEDVELARKEIIQASEHFSRIRAMRKQESTPLPTLPPALTAGLVTVQIRVPYSVVGLVVGPKGSTIKNIQTLTHTYIVTPSRDKDPMFEITGIPENVKWAEREIQAHIALRTGMVPIASKTEMDLLKDDEFCCSSWFQSFMTGSNISDDCWSMPSSDEGKLSGLEQLDSSVCSSLSNLSNQGISSAFSFSCDSVGGRNKKFVSGSSERDLHGNFLFNGK